jgi:hypothetical protein
VGEKDTHDFRESENLVTELLQRGRHVAVLGWYHPYGRLFPESPDLKARSFGFPPFQAMRRSTFAGSVLAQLGFIALPTFGRWISQELYYQFHDAALAAVADAQSDLVFLHYGIPHHPGIYDAARQQMTALPSSETAGYVNNLALVDRTLGELLQQLEKSGLAGKTAVVLTSDHWWRFAPWVESNRGYPVPLIIKLPSGGEPVRVQERIRTIGLRHVIAEIIDGTLPDNAAVAARLRREQVNRVEYRDGVALP